MQSSLGSKLCFLPDHWKSFHNPWVAGTAFRDDFNSLVELCILWTVGACFERQLLLCELGYKPLKMSMFSTASECMLRGFQILELKWLAIVKEQFGGLAEIIDVWNFCKI